MGKSNMHIEKNEHVQWMNMSLPKGSQQQHDVEVEHEKGLHHNQGSFSKTEAKNKGSSGNKRMEDEGSKCCTFCISSCLPCFGFGKAKTVKARKGGIKMDHSSVNHVMSSTFSLENFELINSEVTQEKGIVIQENNNHEQDNSFSSYFDLPSIVLKCSGDEYDA